MDLRERLNTSRMSAYQWLIVGICTLLNALDGYDVLAISFSSNQVSEEFSLSGTALGLVMSAALLGMAIGALVLGPVADRIGRRNMTIVALIVNICGLFLSATATSAAQLGIWRVVTGLGVGGILGGHQCHLRGVRLPQAPRPGHQHLHRRLRHRCSTRRIGDGLAHRHLRLALGLRPRRMPRHGVPRSRPAAGPRIAVLSLQPETGDRTEEARCHCSEAGLHRHGRSLCHDHRRGERDERLRCPGSCSTVATAGSHSSSGQRSSS